MTWRSRPTSVSQSWVNCESPRYLDAADGLAPLAEPGQAEAVAVTGARVIVVHPPSALAGAVPERFEMIFGSTGLRSSGWIVEMTGSDGAGAGGSGMVRGVFRPPVSLRPSSTLISDPARRVLNFFGGPVSERNTRRPG
jgi:hypothetical protein